MRYISVTLLCAFVFNVGEAQTQDKIQIGKVDSIYSKLLKEQRKIWIYTPDITSGAQQSTKRYPVVYLLDGDGHFQSVVGMIQQLSQVNGNTILPEMIVVGIPNTDRTRDLTPTHIVSDPPMMDSNFSKNTGGGETFTAFLEKELMPHIDSFYNTQPYKILIGHSFGGLAVMNILTNHTKLFNAYIAIDPSMWYDNNRFLKTTQNKLAAQKFDGRSLYLGIANTMDANMTLEKMRKDTTVETRHIRSIFALDKSIKANAKNGLVYSSEYYGDDDHSSVPLVSEYDGLRFIFSWYRFKTSRGDFSDSTRPLARKIDLHYQTLSKRFGFKILPPEEMVNGMGYFILGQKHYAKAAALFELNIKNYPTSGNTYDSYADLLLAKKDTAKAIANYQKALSLGHSDETKQKLDRLEGKSDFKPSTQDLEKYIGVFEFESIQLTATTSIKNNALWISASGYGDFELEPLSLHTFGVKGLAAQTVKFEIEDGKLVGMTNTQPNGIFKTKLKK